MPNPKEQAPAMISSATNEAAFKTNVMTFLTLFLAGCPGYVMFFVSPQQ